MSKNADSLMHGFCSSLIVEQHAAAGSPEALRLPNQYSLPGKEFPSLFEAYCESGDYLKIVISNEHTMHIEQPTAFRYCHLVQFDLLGCFL